MSSIFRPALVLFVGCAFALGGCPPAEDDDDDDDAAGGEGEAEARVYDDIDVSFVIDGDRPATVFVPTSYDGITALPFVLLLHGYGITGAQMDRFTGFSALAEQSDIIYASPDGTVDGSGKNFWNASPACCDFAGTDVDDSAWLRSIIDGARERANIDPARIFVVGHSNGAFMTHRMACDHADVIAAVVSMAGAIDAARCAPAEPVAVLQVHGTADTTIRYDGGNLSAGGPNYPAADETAAQWALLDGCDDVAADDPTPLDLDSALAGAETRVTRWSGCQAGGAAELWTVEGAGHVVAGNTGFVPALLDFLFAHPR